MKLKFWERKARDGEAEYTAVKPPESNGYVYIYRKKKTDEAFPYNLCTCFGDHETTMENACLIARALNRYKGKS